MARVRKCETAPGPEGWLFEICGPGRQDAGVAGAPLGAPTSPTRDQIDMRGKLIFLQDQSQPILGLFQARDLDGDISIAGCGPAEPRVRHPCSGSMNSNWDQLKKARDGHFSGVLMPRLSWARTKNPVCAVFVAKFKPLSSGKKAAVEKPMAQRTTGIPIIHLTK
jgi:hypothetical protein